MVRSSGDKQKQRLREREREMKGELLGIERKELKNKTEVFVVLYWWLFSLCVARLNCGDLERFFNK